MHSGIEVASLYQGCHTISMIEMEDIWRTCPPKMEDISLRPFQFASNVDGTFFYFLYQSVFVIFNVVKLTMLLLLVYI